MAIFTALSLEQARALGARFGLDVKAIRGIAAGSVNTGYELGLEGGGRAFLRIYEAQGASGAEREARTVTHLGAHGVPTPMPLSRTDEPGSFVASFRDKPVVIFPWIEGEMVCQRGVGPRHVRAVGDALARIHVAGESFGEAIASRFRAEDLAARLASIRATEALPDDVSRLLPELEARLSRALAAPLRSCVPIVHADLFRDNVLWRAGELAALLDFESASSGSPTFDLVVVLLSWCFGDALDLELGRALVAGYLARRPMPEEERKELYDAALFAALRFTITRITDFELRPRGFGLFKDYRRFVARMRAIEEIGERSFRVALDL